MRLSSYPVLLVFFLLSACLNVDAQAGVEDQRTSPSEINLRDYILSFSEEFDEIDVSEWGCTSKWIAHTPWAGDFGFARFAPPQRKFSFLVEAFPFETLDGVLEIKAEKFPDGRWRSGMLSAWDACNSGFAQRYGYFEIRAKLPTGDGFWPSFWLIGVDKRQGTAEVDVFEHHGHKPHEFSTGIIKHLGPSGEKPYQGGTGIPVEEGVLSRQFNTFGVDLTEDEAVIYFNRKEVWRAVLTPEFQQPMYPLISLAMDEDFTTDETPDSASMYVDYVRIYQRRPPMLQ